MKLGSLFDGSGGFPLAGSLHGITPVWSSEIEAYPLRVTAARFPNVPHLGSVLDINGAEIEPVDIITFGSPCQDLSVAGKQKGIHDGERSSLFFEAIRIAKEMREHDRAAGRANVDLRPRFLVWENVPGAFSSNQGEDFRAVIEALGGIAQDGLSIPRPAKGKWNHAGCVVGDGWSIAWRVYDAQYWGVPQRRKRIYLIADLASERAGEILFERESVCGHPAESGEARQGTTEDAEGCAGGSGCAGLMATGFKANQGPKAGGIGWQDGLACTLNANCPGLEPTVCYDTTQITSPLNYSNPRPGDACHPLAARQHPPLAVYDCRGNGEGNTAQTLTGDHNRRPSDYTTVCVADMVAFGEYGEGRTASTCKARDYKDATDLVIQKNHKRRYIVRRLTPLECCRLQGFPDWWEDGVEGSDSARYKMWGNGIALPCAADVLGRIARELNRR